MCSPFFKKNFDMRELLRFYELLLEFLTNSTDDLPTRESIHDAVFSEKTFSENRIFKLTSEMNRLVNIFLATKFYHRDENELRRELDLAAIYRKKGLSYRLERQNEKLKKGREQEQQESADWYLTKYLISLEENVWEMQNGRGRGGGDMGLGEVISNLNLFFQVQQLEMLNRFLLLQRATSVESPPVVVEALLSPPPSAHFFEQSPLLAITEKIHRLLRQEQPEVEGFRELMGLLAGSESQLSPEALQTFYAYLRNFCTLLIDAGNDEMSDVLHQLHRDNLVRGYFYSEEKISANAVLNIMIIAIRAENLDWAEQFLENHRQRIIGENSTHDFYKINLALCLFAKNKFADALDLIPFSSTNTAYHLMARRLELKIYYELDSELLPSKLDAFRMYVRRAGSTTFSPTLAELYNNFGNLVHQITQSIPGDLKRCEQLIRRIKSKKLVAERNWLLEKVEDLKNGGRRRMTN